MRDDRAIAALRRDPNAKVPEVELVVIRDQDTDRRGVGAILRGHGAGTVPILLTWSEAKQTTWTSTRSKKLIPAS